MATSQQAIQNVEFLELRRVFKEELNDLEKVDKQILDVLKDNNALIKDLVDKIQLASITKGLGKAFSPKKEREEDTELKPDVIKSFGNIKDFVTGFGKRIEEYKEFFFGKKTIPNVEEKPLVETKIEEKIEPKYLTLEEKIPTPKFESRGEKQQLFPERPMLQSSSVKSTTPLLEVPKTSSKPILLEDKGPIAQFVGKSERQQIYSDAPKLEAPNIKQKSLVLEAPAEKQKSSKVKPLALQSKTPLVTEPKPIVPMMLEGPKKKKYDDVIDVAPVQSKTPLVTEPKSAAALLPITLNQKSKQISPILGESKKIETSSVSSIIPTKLIEDITSIKKAMLSDGILVKVINPEELKSEGGREAGGAGALDVAKSGLEALGDIAGKGKTPEKAGSKAGKFLGMAGKAARVLGPAAAIAGAAYSGFEGYQNTASNFDLKEGEEATLGQKVSSTLGGIASGATFGLLNEKTAAQGIQKAGEFVGEKASAAYEGVKSLGGKAVSAVGGFFGGIGDNVRNAFTKGLDEKKGVTQADQLVSTYMSPTDSQESSASGVLSKSNLTEGITSEKTVLGSTFLGKLFSKKGTTTGQFLGQSTNQSLLEANQDVGEHGNVSNLSKISSSTMLGKREAGGILSKDKYSIYSASDGKEETTDLTRTEYNKIQKLVETGKVDEAQSTLQKIKDKREIDKQNAQIYGRTPEDMVTPMSELSRTNEELKRQSSAPINLPPVVSNTVQTNNTQTLSPIKAQPRSSMSSALERYLDRTAVYA